MTPAEEVAALGEIQRLLDEAYTNYFTKSPEHWCKSEEGRVYARFSNFFERRDEGKPFIASVDVYSYVLGPSRMHRFGSVGDALDAVRAWHREEMEHDYEEEGRL